MHRTHSRASNSTRGSNEVVMQATEQRAQQAGAQQPAQTQEYAEAPPLVSAIRMQTQEMRLMLIIGLANGAIIGGFFIIYIVIAVISGEQTSFAPGS
jgi:hypothetical protein